MTIEKDFEEEKNYLKEFFKKHVDIFDLLSNKKRICQELIDNYDKWSILELDKKAKELNIDGKPSKNKLEILLLELNAQIQRELGILHGAYLMQKNYDDENFQKKLRNLRNK